MSEIKGEEVKHKHIGIKALSRPPGLPIARIVYINGTRRPFNPIRVIGLPRGYVISRRYFDPRKASANTLRAATISMSSTGFGEMINKDNPFIIAIIGDA